MKVKYFVYFVWMMLIGIIFSVSAWAADIDMLACPEGCTTLAMDMYLGREILKTDQDFRLNPIATKGYLYNLIEMKNNSARWKTTVFGTNDDVLIFASQGGKEPFAKFITESVETKFKLLYGMLWEVTGHYFITLDPKLGTCADMKGKKLGLGLTTQSDWGMNPTLDLKYGYDIGSENTELIYAGPANLGKLLLNGEVQAIVAGLGAEPTFKNWLPAVLFAELRNFGKPLYYIGHDDTIAEKINEKLKTAYIPIQIPAGTLPYQTHPVKALADGNYCACHESFPEELAYRLTKLTAKVGPKAKLEAGIWQTWSPEMMLAGLSEENTHPGAIRAYKELGWWELTKKFKPVNLPK